MSTPGIDINALYREIMQTKSILLRLEEKITTAIDHDEKEKSNIALLREISQLLCEVGEISENVLKHSKRSKAVYCRALAFYLARMSGIRLVSIGRFFNKDHSTVIYALGKDFECVKNRVQQYPEYYHIFEKVLERLEIPKPEWA